MRVVVVVVVVVAVMVVIVELIAVYLQFGVKLQRSDILSHMWNHVQVLVGLNLTTRESVCHHQIVNDDGVDAVMIVNVSDAV